LLYSYACQCGYITDIEMSIKADHPMIMECPECKNNTLKREWMKKMNFILSDEFKEDNRIHYDRPHPGSHQFY